MMEETRRIFDSLPSFYDSWDEDGLFFQLVDSIAQQIHESREDMFMIMRDRWVDTTKGEDLAKFGALYDMQRLPGESDALFRNRIKSAILGYKGGGTVDSILSLTKSFLGAEDDEIEMIENPLGHVEAVYELESGDTWEMRSESTESEAPRIEVFVGTSGVSLDSAKFDESIFPLGVRDPKFTNLDTGEVMSVSGTLGAGQTLKTFDGGATLDGVDYTDRLTMDSIPRILRKNCRWRYNEAITEMVGAFDSGSFDTSLFRIPVAKVRLTLSWTAHLAATFELKIKEKVFIRKGVSAKVAEEFVSRIKGAGVKHIVTSVD